MIVFEGKKFISADFSSEAELEKVVVENAQLIFGPDSIYLPKALIRSGEGIRTIPDGFAIDLQERAWYIVEAELAAHRVWFHIAPQVTKQIIAAAQPATRSMLADLVVRRHKEDAAVRSLFSDHGIEEIDIRRLLSEIFKKQPIVALPIDRVGQDLQEWALTLKTEVKLWIIRKLIEFGNPLNVLYEIPDEFKPDLDTTEEERRRTGSRALASYAVTLDDLLEAKLLHPGDKLFMSYSPRNGDRRAYEAVLKADGSILVLGQSFQSPSYAALFAIQDAGSDRSSINGWTTWRTESGALLADLRIEFIGSRPDLREKPSA